MDARDVTVAVVAYPLIADADSAWLEGVRASHDPQARLIKGHFTLVFPIAADPQPVVAEVMAAVPGFRSFPFVASEFRAVRNPLGPGGHVFLVPGEGGASLSALHARLYAGLLQPHLRSDIPFVPHLTVAAYADFSRCEQLSEELSSLRRVVRGLVGSVHVIEVTPSRVVSLATVELERNGE